jgi:hypothetical protein
MERIIIVGESEDIEVKVKRFGKYIIVSTERASIARAVSRQIVDAVSGGQQEDDSRIGFKIE